MTRRFILLVSLLPLLASAGNLKFYDGTNTTVRATNGTDGVAIFIDTGSSLYQPLDADLTALAGITGINGDMFVRTNGVWTRLPKGTANQVIKMDGTGTFPAWGTDSTGASVWDNFSTNTVADTATNHVKLIFVRGLGLANPAEVDRAYAADYANDVSPGGTLETSLSGKLDSATAATLYLSLINWATFSNNIITWVVTGSSNTLNARIIANDTTTSNGLVSWVVSGPSNTLDTLARAVTNSSGTAVFGTIRATEFDVGTLIATNATNMTLRGATRIYSDNADGKTNLVLFTDDIATRGIPVMEVRDILGGTVLFSIDNAAQLQGNGAGVTNLPAANNPALQKSSMVLSNIVGTGALTNASAVQASSMVLSNIVGTGALTNASAVQASSMVLSNAVGTGIVSNAAPVILTTNVFGGSGLITNIALNLPSLCARGSAMIALNLTNGCYLTNLITEAGEGTRHLELTLLINSYGGAGSNHVVTFPTFGAAYQGTYVWTNDARPIFTSHTNATRTMLKIEGDGTNLVVFNVKLF